MHIDAHRSGEVTGGSGAPPLVPAVVRRRQPARSIHFLSLVAMAASRSHALLDGYRAEARDLK